MLFQTLLRCLLSLLLTGIFSIAAFAGDISVVANQNNRMNKLSGEEVRQIFLGRMRASSAGESIFIVDQSQGSSVRETFYQKATEMSARQAGLKWASLLFSGVATMPKEVKDDAEVKLWIQAHPDTVGYINSGAVDANLKVLFTVSP
jgi:ABC-type phosphate transport system substrate-binding protein